MLELVAIQLTHVKRILASQDVRYSRRSGLENHEETIRRQHAPDLAHHLVVPLHVLDGLEAHDDIDRVLGQWNRVARTDAECEIRTLVLRSGVGDDVGGDIHPRDVRGGVRQHRRPVALAARDIKNPLAACEFARNQVPVHVLEPDLAPDFWDVPLSGPCQCWCVCAMFFTHPSAVAGLHPLVRFD